MKKILHLLLALVLLSGCISKKTQDSEYASSYDSVYSYIQNNWEKYLSVHKDTTFPKLPHPGISYLKEFLTQFYWDSFFNNEGLLLEKKNQYIAKYHIENLLFEVDQIGFVPNMNSHEGASRSQPPYLSMMVKNYYESVEPKDKKLLEKGYFTLIKEYNFWMDKTDNPIENHRTSVPGLIHYFHHGDTSDLLSIYNHMVNRLAYPKEAPLATKLKQAVPYITEAGTGMDFTPRFEGRCPEFIAVDLNSNMYMYEKNFAWMVKELGIQHQPNWDSLADYRKKMINKYLWNEQSGLYLDYDYVNKRSGHVAAATTFSPLFAGIASQEQAEKVAKNLPLFEQRFGLSVVDKNTKEKLNYMWGNDDLWAPMQYLAIAGLRNYNLHEDALRLSKKWMDLITKNYISPTPAFSLVNGKDTVKYAKGRVYEKYSLKNGGSINADEYPALEILCWSAGVYAYAYKYVKSKE